MQLFSLWSVHQPLDYHWLPDLIEGYLAAATNIICLSIFQ